ncbi:MAG: nucleotidyltransferase domain-containing protein [Chloroflexi bacterium]|nr:nucleotidyltransferase domain-containing protein [Chloroflexota bacterium]
MPTRKNTSPKPKRISEVKPVYKALTSRPASPAKSKLLVKCKKNLAQAYGERLKGVILYGSMARKQAAPSSDVDLLVLLAPPVDYFAELWRLVDILYPIQLESERLISAKPVSISDFDAGSISLYRNAKREGIAV